MIIIRPMEIEDAAGVAECIDKVVRERRYLGNTVGFSEEETRDYIQMVKDCDGVHLVVVDGETIVGWCDITPYSYEGLTHVGRLGMGLLPPYRGQGWGTKLVSKAVQEAFEREMERIELYVFASNVGALKLYRQGGFIEEGLKRQGRKLDGEYDDIVIFGLLRTEWQGP